MRTSRMSRGNTLSEYGLAGAIILCMAVLVLSTMGGSISNLLGRNTQVSQVDIVPGLMSTAGAPGVAGTGGVAPPRAVNPLRFFQGPSRAWGP